MEEHPRLKKIFFPIEKCPFEWIDLDEMLEEILTAKYNHKAKMSKRWAERGSMILLRWKFVQIFSPSEKITDYYVSKYVTKSANESFCIYGELENKCPDVKSFEIDCEGLQAVPRKYSLPDENNELGTYKFIVQRCNRFLEERDVLKRISEKLGQPILKTHDSNDVGYAFQFMQIENTTPKLIKSAFEDENWLASDFKEIDDAENEFESFNYSKRHYQICLRNVKMPKDRTIEKCLKLFEENGFINYFSTESDIFAQLKHKQFIGQLLLSKKYWEAFKKIRQVNPSERSKWEMIRCAFSLSLLDLRILRKYLEKAEKMVSDKTNLTWKCLSAPCHQIKFNKHHLPKDFFDNVDPQQIINYVEFTLQSNWNQMVNKIIESRHGLILRPGDLVFVDKEAEKRVEEDEFGACVPAHSWIPGYYSTLVRPLTHTDIDSGKYTVYDWVVPIPGGEVILPENSSKGLIKSVYYHGWKCENKEVPLQTIGQVKIRGSYRKVLLKPENLKWKLKFYSDDNEPLLLDDLTKDARMHEVENLKREVDVSVSPWRDDWSQKKLENQPEVAEHKSLKIQERKQRRLEKNNHKGGPIDKESKPEPNWRDIEEIDGMKRPEGSKVALILDFHLQKKTSYLIALRQLLQNDKIFSSKINEHYDPNKVRHEDMAKLKEYILATSKVLKQTFKVGETQAKQDTFQKLTPSGKPLRKDLAFVYTKKGNPNIYAIRKFMDRVKKAKGVERAELEKKAKAIRKLVGPHVMKSVEHSDNGSNPYQQPHTKKVIKRACSKLLNVLEQNQQMSSQFSHLLNNVKELVKTVDEPSSSAPLIASTSYIPQPSGYMYNNGSNFTPNVEYPSYVTSYSYPQQYTAQSSQYNLPLNQLPNYAPQYPNHELPQTSQMLQRPIQSSNGNYEHMFRDYDRGLRGRDSRERSDDRRRSRERDVSPTQDRHDQNKRYRDRSATSDTSNWRFADEGIQRQTQNQFISIRDDFPRDLDRYSPSYSREQRSYRSPDRRSDYSRDRYHETRDHDFYRANQYNHHMHELNPPIYVRGNSYGNRIDGRNEVESRSNQYYSSSYALESRHQDSRLHDSRHQDSRLHDPRQEDRLDVYRSTSRYGNERRSYRSPSPGYSQTRYR